MDRLHRRLKWFQALGPLFFLHRDPMPLVSILSPIALIFEAKFAVIDRSLPVHLAPVSHFQHQDAQRPVLDVGHDAVVAHAVLPEFP